jgi:hypothetical protein
MNVSVFYKTVEVRILLGTSVVRMYALYLLLPSDWACLIRMISLGRPMIAFGHDFDFFSSGGEIGYGMSRSF